MAALPDALDSFLRVVDQIPQHLGSALDLREKLLAPLVHARQALIHLAWRFDLRSWLWRLFVGGAPVWPRLPGPPRLPLFGITNGLPAPPNSYTPRPA